MAVQSFRFDPGQRVEDADIDYIVVTWPIPPAQEFEVFKPSDGQMLAVASSIDRGGVGAIGAVMNLFEGIFPPEGYQRLRDYLNDPHYPSAAEKLIELFFSILEVEAPDRPTKSPSGSSRSSQAGGRSSTGSARQPASTRSPSRSRVSSTSSTPGS